MRIINTRIDSPNLVAQVLLTAERSTAAEVESTVRGIVDAVRTRGDAAVREFLRRYDQVELGDLEVSQAEFEAAEATVDREFSEAVDLAIFNVRTFHERTKRESWQWEADGALLGQLVRPLARVGIHVPAGKAPLPSTVIMAAVLARVAGVPSIIACSAPQRDGTASPYTLVAARRAGVERVFKVGGAQAVAAMAYGTETIPGVDKIVGPGNAYTIAAKRMVFGQVGIESLPGPTEVVIIADDTADPRWLAADLLAQAEHGADSVAILLTPSERLAQAVATEVESQLPARVRSELMRTSLAERGYVVITRDLEEACDLANRCAPEHLDLVVQSPGDWLHRITNAGAVLIGGHTPPAIADYVAGPSHILPTGGTARFSSALQVDDFVKRISVISYDQARFEREAPHVVRLAEAETLEGHAHAVRIRNESINGAGASSLSEKSKQS